jgi:hypothetical protein
MRYDIYHNIMTTYAYKKQAKYISCHWFGIHKHTKYISDNPQVQGITVAPLNVEV